MKFQRIGTGLPIARIAIFTLLLLATGPAFAVDEDIPPPSDTELPPAKGSISSPNVSNPLSEDESIPAPTLGDDALPEPSVDRGQENAKNRVNRPPEDDEIFLPTPNVNDNVYYAPVGTPAPRVTSEDVDWRVLNSNRPNTQFYAGWSYRGYPNPNVRENRVGGWSLGASYNIWNITQMIHAHLYASFTFTRIGDVGTVSNVVDETFHFGPMFEIALGRRFSVYGTVFYRSTLMSASRLGLIDSVQARRNLADAGGIGTHPELFLGARVQWDPWVWRHHSIGFVAHLERDLYQILFSLALEPETKARKNLNYEDMESR